jgi:UDP-N-acetylmuramoylalanine--D-glutamate ligase
MRRYPGLAHRQELVATIDGVRYVNDSKATNAEAAARALSCYANIYWIAGGQAKGDGLQPLEPFLPHIRHAFLIGEAAANLDRALAGRVDTTCAGELASAVRQAHDRAQREALPDPVVLLSPACASYDQFENFEHRGRAFRADVTMLPGSARSIHGNGEAA